MDNKRNHGLVDNARSLRREMTKEERHLWYDYLRHHTIKFRRQAVLGRYIVDFYCAKAKLVIELDGSQHYETQNQQADQIRTEYLEQFRRDSIAHCEYGGQPEFQRSLRIH